MSFKPTQKQRMIALLRQRGLQGVNNYEFPQQFILDYTARLTELKQEGYKIIATRVKDNIWKYVLYEEKVIKSDWRTKKKAEKVRELEDAGQEKFW